MNKTFQYLFSKGHNPIIFGMGEDGCMYEMEDGVLKKAQTIRRGLVWRWLDKINAPVGVKKWVYNNIVEKHFEEFIDDDA